MSHPNVSNGKDSESPALEAIVLGGAGDFGMNMMALKSGTDSLLVDAGAAFPGLTYLGIESAIPNIDTFASEVGMIGGLVLTHGHEDHIGAVPFIWNVLEGNIYGTDITLALLARKLKEHSIAPGDRLKEISPGSHFSVGVFNVEFINVAHSVPGSVALAIKTPVGTILHTGDYKMKTSPKEASRTDKCRLAEIGAEGVLAMFGDSTNALVPGHTPDEECAYRGLESVFETSDTRIFVTTFSSSLNRIRTLFELANIYGRKVVLIGRSLINNVQLAERLGYLHIPPNLYAEKSSLRHYPKKELLVILTGSQGEPRSALHRVAVDSNGPVPLEAGDVIAFSARVIPGNERQVNRLVNRLVNQGIEVIQNAKHPIHVSGHGSEEDLKEMLSLVKPRYTIPIHGEHAQLHHHAGLIGANSTFNSTALRVKNGDRLCFTSNEIWLGCPIEINTNYIDQDHQICTAGEALLQERRTVAQSGLLVITIENQKKNTTNNFQISTRGLRMSAEDGDITGQVEDCIKVVLANTALTESHDLLRLEAEIQRRLRSLFRSKKRTCPDVLTVVTEPL